jgi:hypothetical protein
MFRTFQLQVVCHSIQESEGCLPSFFALNPKLEPMSNIRFECCGVLGRTFSQANLLWFSMCLMQEPNAT